MKFNLITHPLRPQVEASPAPCRDEALDGSVLLPAQALVELIGPLRLTNGSLSIF